MDQYETSDDEVDMEVDACIGAPGAAVVFLWTGLEPLTGSSSSQSK
jgi:hypothetical protein